MSSTRASSHFPTFQSRTTRERASEFSTPPDKSNSQDPWVEDYLRTCQPFLDEVKRSGLRLDGIMEPGKDGRNVKKVTVTWSNRAPTPTGHKSLSQELPNIGKNPGECRVPERGPLPSLRDLLLSPR
ncbi:hypothetical protein NW759_015866 [Fusarium solani]|nr:hypothetical protein NW759_015866 [Fusarium solani]